MILLGQKSATEKNHFFFFITDMENTRSKLSYVRKSSPVTILQSALNCGTKNLLFHEFILPDLVIVLTKCVEL